MIKPTPKVLNPTTELQHMELAWLLWDDLATHGHSNKQRSRYYPKIRYMKLDCPLCEVYYSNCKKKCCLFVKRSKCWDGAQPYRKWEEAKTKRTRQKYARMVANQILEAINKRRK